jgi:hypothetical protein|tara:strand:+ start:10806 stop:11714 length:909 start_codon:yes stop_codon:yes gene_type:complete
MSSWNDDDGIYVSSIRNYNYGQYFSDLANDIIEEYEDSGIVDSEDSDNLPWGYKPDQTQIFIDFYPRYSGYGYPYGYGSLYGYGYYPYNYYWGRNFYNPYYPYGYYSYGYGYPESHQYWPYRNRLRLYPYYYYDRYNYNGYAYNKDKDPVNTTRLGYSNSSSRRGEKTSSASRESSNIRNTSTPSVSSRSGGYNISSNDVPNLRAIKENYRVVNMIQRQFDSNSRYINSSRYNNSRDYTGSTIGKFNSNSRPTNGVYGKSSNSRSSSGSSNVGTRSSGNSSGGGSRGGSSSGGGSRGGGSID